MFLELTFKYCFHKMGTLRNETMNMIRGGRVGSENNYKY